MGIKKKSDGTFSVSYSKRHPITRQPVSRLREGIKTKAEASRVHAELIVAVSDILKRKIIPTWEIFLAKYLNDMDLKSVLSKGTIYNRQKVIEAHTMSAWKNRCIDEISTKDIHEILKERFRDMSEAHKKHFVKCIRGVFQYAVDEGVIEKNPTPLLKFKISDKIKSVLNGEQIELLLRKAQEQNWHWYPHYAVALNTGMRNGELYALTWDKVNLEQRQILINASWSSKDGFKSTKSGDDRIVEIPKPLLPVLRELKLKSLGDDYVLPRMSKWDKGEQARELRFFLKSIGLPEIRFHDLRASWATLLLNNGVAPSKVMFMGGWKDLDTMMIYMRKAGIAIKDSTACLDNMHFHGVQAAKVMTFPSV